VKVLIVAEGEHELHGALQKLVERLCQQSLDCTSKSSIHDQPRTRRKVRLTGGAFKKKALAWLVDAQEDGFEALVFLIDFDRGEDDRVKQLNEAQEIRSPEFHLNRAFGVAIRSFDAWMLADEAALSDVFGRVVDRLSEPEGTKEPKSELRRVAQAGGDRSRGHRQDYLHLAEKLNLSTLEQRCPKGFKPFADRIRKLKSL
jgi:hypothetical protein